MAFYDDNDPYFQTEDSYNNRIGKGSQLRGFSRRSQVALTTGDERIKESILDILSTRIGTRFMMPQYGCGIHDILFEQNTFVVQDLACEYVKDALKKFEPRITVLDISSKADFDILEVRFNYRVNDLGTIGSFVYTIDRQTPSLDMGL